jgi:phospholipase/carboxylesterase
MTDFIHRFEPGTNPNGPTLLLLHGTGGNETDLLPLGRELTSWNLLSPRGPVLENGMPRFFRRLREGVFDEEDVQRRANELTDFIGEAATQYGFDAGNVWALGYSNGANIAAATMMLRPEALRGAAMWRGMMPLSDAAPQDLSGRRALLLSGIDDPFAPRAAAQTLAAWLRTNGADITYTERAGGHSLQSADIEETRAWLAQAA